MKKIVNNTFLETYYTKVLDNGLTVVLFDKKEFHNNFFTLITPYGAADYNQKDDSNNTYHLPPGVAHFLEHRMFDYQGFDVMERFTELGSTSNASTGYDQTQYYFGTTHDNYFESLDLLLDFVFDLTIPLETVEKEKGIIIEELMMYDGMPDFKLYFGVLKNLYHNLPYIEDIGGSVESVSRTTLEDLELAYKLNYHPKQMVLVGGTNGDIDEVMNFIEENMSKKSFGEYKKLERDYELEPLTVSKEYEEHVMDINKSKLGLGYKFKHGVKDIMKRDEMENLLSIYFDMLFSSVNEDYQTWLDDEIINDYFDVDVSIDEDFGHIFISNETDDVEGFKSFIEDIINNPKKYVSEAKFNQIKKRVLGRAIQALEQPSTIAQVYGRNIAEGIDVFESIETLKDLSIDDLLELTESLEFLEHGTTFVIKAK